MAQKLIRWTLLAACAIGLAGCLKFAIGDPSTSKIDPRLVGYWQGDEGKDKDGNPQADVVMLTPLDQHVYLMRYIEYKTNKDGSIERGNEMVAKCWLTDVKGATFMVMQMMGEPLPGEQPKPADYPTMRLEIAADKVTMKIVSDDFAGLKDAKNADEVTAIIAKDLNTPSLYGDPTEFRKMTDSKEDKEILNKLMAF